MINEYLKKLILILTCYHWIFKAIKIYVLINYLILEFFDLILLLISIKNIYIKLNNLNFCNIIQITIVTYSEHHLGISEDFLQSHNNLQL